MSGMFPVCMLLVKGCQTLVMDPTSLLQQSLVNEVLHTIMVHPYLLWSLRKLILRTKILPNFLTTHHWCLAWIQCVCCLWRVVRPCSWTQPAYCNNHWWIQCLIPSWYTDTYSSHCCELILQTKILPNFLTTHHWCLTCSQCVCRLWRVVRPWSWTQLAYCNNHW